MKGLPTKTLLLFRLYAMKRDFRPLRLAEEMGATIHRAARRCQVPGCLGVCSGTRALELCDLHQAAIWFRELIELRDKAADASCSIGDLESYLFLAVEMAKVRAAAAKWN